MLQQCVEPHAAGLLQAPAVCSWGGLGRAGEGGGGQRVTLLPFSPRLTQALRLHPRQSYPRLVFVVQCYCRIRPCWGLILLTWMLLRVLVLNVTDVGR